MKRQIARAITWALIISALLATTGKLIDRAMNVEAYKTCKSIEREVNPDANCDQRFGING